MQLFSLLGSITHTPPSTAQKLPNVVHMPGFQEQPGSIKCAGRLADLADDANPHTRPSITTTCNSFRVIGSPFCNQLICLTVSNNTSKNLNSIRLRDTSKTARNPPSARGTLSFCRNVSKGECVDHRLLLLRPYLAYPSRLYFAARIHKNECRRPSHL